MKQNTTPNAFNPQYLIEELMEILHNNPNSLPRLLENIMNVDYDFDNKENELYKILNEEQREHFKQIHLRRQTDKQFDQKVQYAFTIAGCVIGLGYGAVKLFEYFDERREERLKKQVIN